MMSTKLATELITPAAAEKILENRTKNRKLKRMKVRQYAKDMEKDNWQMTGEPIIFDEKGRLIDGYHRIQACIDSDTAFRTAVVRGVATKNFVYIDSGSNRSAGDVLSADGFTQYKAIAAAIKVIDSIGRMEKSGGARKNGKKYGNPVRWTRRFSHSEVLNFARKNKKRLEESAGVVRNTKEARKLLSPNSVFVALFYTFARRGGINRARGFFAALITGENLDPGDPVLKVREYLFNIKGERGIQYSTICATTIKAWNSWIQGEPLSVLSYDKDSEAWPAISKA